MNSKSPPEGYHSITPYFTVANADELIDFLVAAFDASIVIVKRYADDKIQHARLRIGDSIVMVNESSEDYPVNVSQMYLYVENADASFAKALATGASKLMEPNDRPHFYRLAGVRDQCVNIWWIAKNVRQ